MRAWGKIKTQDTIKDDFVLDATDFASALETICTCFNLSKPIVCSKHLKEIEAFSRTVFYEDDFVEPVDFDTLEIEIIGDKKKDEN